ncbi:MAG: hypothetical protein WBD31_32750 [Rubripirellula sp.]
MTFRCLAITFWFAILVSAADGDEIDDKLTQFSSDAATQAASGFSARKLDLIQKRQAAEQKIRTTFDVELTKLRDAMVAKLKAALEVETKKGNLDAAVQIRDAIQLVETAEAAVLAPEVADKDRVIESLREQNAALGRDLIAAKKRLGESAVAQIEVLSGSSGLGEFRNKARAFSNRKYHWVGVPDEIPCAHVTTVAGGGDKPLVVRVVSAGSMRVAISHDTTAVGDYMRKEGWRSTNQRFGYSDNKPSLLYVYIKQVEPGIISLPNMAWAGPVVLLP